MAIGSFAFAEGSAFVAGLAAAFAGAGGSLAGRRLVGAVARGGQTVRLAVEAQALPQFFDFGLQLTNELPQRSVFNKSFRQIHKPNLPTMPKIQSRCAE